MELTPLSEIVRMISGNLISGGTAKQISHISTDSRQLSPGDLFIPLKGENFDGHNFIPQAIENGATVVFVEKEKVKLQDYPPTVSFIAVDNTLLALGKLTTEYRKLFNIPIIAITGSSGKTTVKEMIATILNSCGPTLSSPKSWNNQIGLPLTLLELTKHHQFCVLELGTNHFGEIAQLSAICRPTIGVVTNIGKAHLESFGDIKGVLREKMSLFTNLSPSGKAVINLDDPNLAEYSLNVQRITFSLRNKNADVWISKIRQEKNGLQFNLFAGHQTYDVFMPMVGIFNVYNALAAAACIYSMEIDLEYLVKSLKQFIGPPMRMETIQLANGTILVNDSYNANPNSMRESIITFLKLYSDKKKILVLGDMLELGLSSADEHYELGRFLANFSVEYLFLVGSEMKNLAWGIKDKNKKLKNVFHSLDKNEISENLTRKISKNSAVFFKGSRKNKLEELVEKLKERKL